MSKSEIDPPTWPASLFVMPPNMLSFFGATSEQAAATPDAAAGQQAVANATAPWNELAQNLAKLQQDYFQQVSGMWGTPPAAATGADTSADKRFAGDAWKGDARFEVLTNSYLAYSSMLHKAVEALPLDEKVRGQWAFAMRHLTDALSPGNFLVSNPDAMQLVVETGGKSLIEGMGLLVQDLLKGRISMTDESAFQLGENVATTAGSVVYENELIQLIQYTPLTKKVHQRPLLMVPPCINKYYILDLQPENSLVRFGLEQGHTVMMLSWRNASAETANFTWDDYLETGVMSAIDAALAITGADKVDALGFCLGGTLLACATAVEKARGIDRVASMTLLTTMLEFGDTGELGLLVTEQSVASREAAIGQGGIMKGADLAVTFAALRANDLIWPYVINGYLKGKAPPAFDLLYWNSDATNLPGPMYCWYLRNTYLENNLAEPNGTEQCGVTVDLSTIDVPAFIYASREDHIVPWQTAFRSGQVLGGDTTFVLGASGHIAGVINPPAKKKRNHWMGGDASGDAQHWFDSATNVPGSWWSEWSRWLASHAGPMVGARQPGAQEGFEVIEAAPGRYVKEKAA